MVKYMSLAGLTLAVMAGCSNGKSDKPVSDPGVQALRAASENGKVALPADGSETVGKPDAGQGTPETSPEVSDEQVGQTPAETPAPAPLPDQPQPDVSEDPQHSAPTPGDPGQTPTKPDVTTPEEQPLPQSEPLPGANVDQNGSAGGEIGGEPFGSEQVGREPEGGGSAQVAGEPTGPEQMGREPEQGQNGGNVAGGSEQGHEGGDVDQGQSGGNVAGGSEQGHEGGDVDQGQSGGNVAGSEQGHEGGGAGGVEQGQSGGNVAGSEQGQDGDDIADEAPSQGDQPGQPAQPTQPGAGTEGPSEQSLTSARELFGLGHEVFVDTLAGEIAELDRIFAEDTDAEAMLKEIHVKFDALKTMEAEDAKLVESGAVLFDEFAKLHREHGEHIREHDDVG